MCKNAVVSIYPFIADYSQEFEESLIPDPK